LGIRFRSMQFHFCRNNGSTAWWLGLLIANCLFTIEWWNARALLRYNYPPEPILLTICGMQSFQPTVKLDLVKTLHPGMVFLIRFNFPYPFGFKYRIFPIPFTAILPQFRCCRGGLRLDFKWLYKNGIFTT